MRLIDADALFQAMETAGWYNNADRDEVAEKLVMDAPTIEPRKGRWVECDHDKWSGDTFAYRCSECAGAYHLNIEQVISIWDFCPNCGADMREGADG